MQKEKRPLSFEVKISFGVVALPPTDDAPQISGGYPHNPTSPCPHTSHCQAGSSRPLAVQILWSAHETQKEKAQVPYRLQLKLLKTELPPLTKQKEREGVPHPTPPTTPLRESNAFHIQLTSYRVRSYPPPSAGATDAESTTFIFEVVLLLVLANASLATLSAH